MIEEMSFNNFYIKYQVEYNFFASSFGMFFAWIIYSSSQLETGDSKSMFTFAYVISFILITPLWIFSLLEYYKKKKSQSTNRFIFGLVTGLIAYYWLGNRVMLKAIAGDVVFGFLGGTLIMYLAFLIPGLIVGDGKKGGYAGFIIGFFWTFSLVSKPFTFFLKLLMILPSIWIGLQGFVIGFIGGYVGKRIESKLSSKINEDL